MANDNQQSVNMEHIHKLHQEVSKTQSNMDCLIKQMEKSDEQSKNLTATITDLVSEIRVSNINIKSVEKRQDKNDASLTKLDERMDEMDRRVSVLQETIRWMNSKPVIAGVFVLVLIAASPFIKSLLT